MSIFFNSEINCLKSAPILKKEKTNQATNPATLMAMFIKVNLLENLTLLSPQHWSLEKVKNVNMGRRRREG